MSDYLGDDMRKVRGKDGEEKKKEIRSLGLELDEDDIALLKTYSQGAYWKTIKQVKDGANELGGIKESDASLAPPSLWDWDVGADEQTLSRYDDLQMYRMIEAGCGGTLGYAPTELAAFVSAGGGVDAGGRGVEDGDRGTQGWQHGRQYSKNHGHSNGYGARHGYASAGGGGGYNNGNGGGRGGGNHRRHKEYKYEQKSYISVRSYLSQNPGN